jgi:pilus assembly protein CpaE
VNVISAAIIVSNNRIGEELQAALSTLPVRVLFALCETPDDWLDLQDRIDRVRPELILLDITQLREPLEVVIRRFRETSAQPAVFALHTSADPAAILAAMRAGASEYLFPPFAQPLQAALERWDLQQDKKSEQHKGGGRTIGFLSTKGGCGATTVACHVAARLPEYTKSRVLLADCDLQTGLIGFLLKSKSSYTIADAANNLARLDPSYWRALVSNGIPGLEIIAAPNSPQAKRIAPGQLKQVLAFARRQYEWTVADLGRNLDETTLTLIDAIDETYVVTTCDVPALHQAKHIIQTLLEGGYAPSRLRLIINRLEKRADITTEELQKMLGIAAYATLGDDPVALREAHMDGRLIADGCPLGRSIADLTARIAGVETRKKKFAIFG